MDEDLAGAAPGAEEERRPLYERPWFKSLAMILFVLVILVLLGPLFPSP
jgi:hypothetical protein